MESLVNQLNSILSSLSDRLDALEGARGHGVIRNRVDITDDNGNRVGGFTNESL